MQGHIHNGLYRFSPIVQNKVVFNPTMNATSLSSSFMSSDVLELWHKRLGYLSIL